MKNAKILCAEIEKTLEALDPNSKDTCKANLDKIICEELDDRHHQPSTGNVGLNALEDDDCSAPRPTFGVRCAVSNLVRRTDTIKL